MNSPVGVYIHIPFCEQKCPYCDFYSMQGSEAQKQRYFEAVLGAIKCCPFPLLADTVYFGGGTPTLLGADRLVKILESIPRCENSEVTLEANPKTVTPQGLRALVAGGFNRISFGVQSTDETILATLGRIHSAADAFHSIEAAQQAGFSHISADLMLCVPNQSVADVIADIDRLASLPLDHISAYLLKIEEETPFFHRYTEGGQDAAADCYLAAVNRLSERGFSQYEISNFARNDAAQSRHNRKYWECKEYLGIGPAAHSMMSGRRFYFNRNIEAFIQSDDVWAQVISDGDGGTREEMVMLGLRLCEGIATALLPADKLAKAQTYAKYGLAQIADGRLGLTPAGFLVSNQIIAELLG